MKFGTQEPCRIPTLKIPERAAWYITGFDFNCGGGLCSCVAIIYIHTSQFTSR